MAQVETTYHIEWRPLAIIDLHNIVDYIAIDNPIRAQTFGQELRKKALALVQYPKLGRKGRPGVPPFARELIVHRNYMILYRVLEDTRTIQILRVKHTARQRP